MRTLISRTRLRDPEFTSEDLLTRTYATTMRLAAEAVLDRWARGEAVPGNIPHLKITQATCRGMPVGFNVWMVTDEPLRLGGSALESEEVGEEEASPPNQRPSPVV